MRKIANQNVIANRIMINRNETHNDSFTDFTVQSGYAIYFYEYIRFLCELPSSDDINFPIRPFLCRSPPHYYLVVI